jgi:hypothetical protein
MFMISFFDHPHQRSTPQQLFLEKLSCQSHVIVALPSAELPVRLYGFSSLFGMGLAIIVVPYVFQACQRHAFFSTAGLQFPQVALLHQEQAPHEQRAVLNAINQEKVNVLCITANRFSSLGVLQVLVHAKIARLMIEEADRFLPLSVGSKLYNRFLKEGLAQFRQLPSTVLMTGVLSYAQQDNLSKTLGLQNVERMQISYELDQVQLIVHCLMTQKQKLDKLIKVIEGLNLQMDAAKIQIYTRSTEETTCVQNLLNQKGFGCNAVVNQGDNRVLIASEGEKNKPDLYIQVGTSSCLRLSYELQDEKPVDRVVFWNLPASLDELTMVVLSRPDKTLLPSSSHSNKLEVTVLHTKEDFEEALADLERHRQVEIRENQQKIVLLRYLRQWILSSTCRLASLCVHVQHVGTVGNFSASCGHCDICMAGTYKLLGQWWKRGIRHLLY